MKMYALLYKVGISSGYHELVGIYDSMEALENGKEKDKKKSLMYRDESHYSVEEISVNKNVNIVYCDW